MKITENHKNESIYTEPRDDCPNPELWHSIDGESTEYEVSYLVGAFVRALKPNLVVETGSGFGETTELIGEAIDENCHWGNWNSEGLLISLESDERRAKFVRNRCRRLPVKVINSSSLDFNFSEFTTKIDFLWLDSNVDIRAKEIVHFKPFMSKRCVIGVHDTGPHKPVCTYLSDLVEAGIINQPLYLSTPRGVCFTSPILG